MPSTSSAKKTKAKKATAKKTVVAKKPAPKLKLVKSVKMPAPPAKKATAPRASTTSSGKLEVGTKAPNFSLPATLVGTVSSASLKGQNFVLYFYPKDDTSGCTAESCGFRDAMPKFDRLDTQIIGISKDSLASHEKFQKKYDLTFPLASDEGSKVCESFGTWVEKSMYGRSYMGIERSTFLVDANGIIRAIWRKVSVPGHVDEVRRAVAEL